MVIKRQENNDDLVALMAAFDAFEIDYYKCGTTPIFHVFCFKCENDSLLNEKWEDITSYLACNFQTGFETEFEKWNFYLLFFLENTCPVDLKYEIENDKFSSRKLVLDNYPSKSRDYKTIIKNKIFDLDIDLSKEKILTDTKNIENKSEVIKLINASGSVLSSDGRSQEKELNSLYEELFQIYRDEI